jgi:hypothetical protein
MYRGKLKNLSLLQSATGTWAMLTKGTEWLIAIQLVREHGSGQEIIFTFLGPNYTE